MGSAELQSLKINLSKGPESFRSCHLIGEPDMFPSHVYEVPQTVSWLKTALKAGARPPMGKAH